MKRIILVGLFITGFSAKAGEYKPLHRVFIYPKLGFSSNFSNYNSFTMLADVVYRLSLLKGLGLSWELGFSVTSMGAEGVDYTYYGFPIRVGVMYEFDLQMELVPYAETGVGLISSILDNPVYGRDSYVHWQWYGGGGVMYRLGKGLIAGGIRWGYSALPKGAPLKAKIDLFQLFAGYVYEF